MTTFSRFDAPGLLTELSIEGRDTWSATMAEHTEQFAFVFDRYFNPTTANAPDETTDVAIIWSASPARLRGQLTDRQRWSLADQSRDEQDEYCEWVTQRDPSGRLLSVTFSTEAPEYWSHIAESESDPDLLLDLYHELVDAQVPAQDLFDTDDTYMPDNPWNNATSNGIAHLRQSSNTLLAALRLAAESTIQRVDRQGNRVTDRRELIICGRLGEPLRNSDPQIADIVNGAVAAGSTVTLNNPLGLYLDGLQSAGFVTPDGADAGTFWTTERGEPGHTVRAKFEVPQGHDYALGDLTLDGRPLEFGAQVADKVRVRIDALLAPGTTPVTTRPCASPTP